MKVDLAVTGPDLRHISSVARLAEDIGFDALCVPGPDPFAPLACAAEATERIGLHASVPLPRDPVALAHRAGDLQEYARGRFVLGLSGRPAGGGPPSTDRLRAAVPVLRAVWREAGPYGPPRLFLAAVGPRMTELAGEVADGLILPGFTTARFLQKSTVPALERGLRRSGRGWEDLEVVAPAYAVTGRTDEEYERAVHRARRAIAGFGAVPAYRRVLETHGWGELQDDLGALARRGRWTELPGLIGDEVVDACAVRGAPGEIPDLLVARYGAVCRRIRLTGPFHREPGLWAAVVSRIHDITSEPVPS